MLIFHTCSNQKPSHMQENHWRSTSKFCLLDVANLQKKITRTGMLIDWVLGWLNLWWWELDLWKNMGVLSVVFYRIKRKKKKKWGRGSRLSSYNLNITDEFTNEYLQWAYFLGNFVCNNDTSFFSSLDFQL
jgi:hypothetical protein